MSFNFIDKTFTIGGEGTPMLQFYNRGFVLGSGKSEPTWKDIIISGNTALTLVNAKADGLNYVKLFGATEQDDTEYLNAVTLSGGTEQTNLPEGYTQLKYVQNAPTTTKINTGVMPEVGDELEIKFITPYSGATSNYLLQSRENNNAGIFGISGSQSGATILLSWGSGNSITSNIARVYNHVYVVKASVIGTTLTLYVKDVTAGTEDTVTGTITTPSDASTPYFIWGNASQWLQQVTPIYYAKVTNNGVTKLNYVASKDSNNSASFYDLVNDTFITTFDGTITGSADVATPTPATPISILTNNGTIKVSKNLFDMSKAVLGDIASADGSISTSILYRIVSDYIPVQVGRSYIASGLLRFENLPDDYIVRLIIAFYDSNKEYISGSRTTSSLGFTVTDNGASYVRVEFWGDPASGNTVDLVNSKLQFELGTTATTYTPYGMYIDGTTETVTDNNGNTANAEMLLRLSNYVDTQEILSGVVNRNIGIKILDGNENWSVTSDTYPYFSLLGTINNSIISNSTHKCTHFPSAQILGTNNNQGVRINRADIALRYDDLFTATANNLPLFKRWLAEQYIQGTPVAIVYPFETTETETVEGQILEEQPIVQTAGSIPNLSVTLSTSSDPTPIHQKNIVCNNGVLKVSANILNLNDLEGSYLLTDQGQKGSSNDKWILTNFIKVKPNTSYIFDFISSGDYIYRRVCGYSSNDYNSFTELLVKKQRPTTEDERYSLSFTTSATTNYIKVSTCKADTNIQITEGTVAIPYRPYGEVYTNDTIETVTDSLSNTATAEMLLAIDNFKDVQSVLDGNITRNIGIKVFDGTENWSRTDARVSLVLGDNSADENFEPFCTHYLGCKASLSLGALPDNGCKFSNATNNPILIKDNVHNTDINTWKAYLAEQYTNGTPVILVYPLATSTTETVTGQTLTTQAGTNTITATGAIDDLELEVSYKAGVSVTITQIQNANLDNSVVITIGE